MLHHDLQKSRSYQSETLFHARSKFAQNIFEKLKTYKRLQSDEPRLLLRVYRLWSRVRALCANSYPMHACNSLPHSWTITIIVTNCHVLSNIITHLNNKCEHTHTHTQYINKLFQRTITFLYLESMYSAQMFVLLDMCYKFCWFILS